MPTVFPFACSSVAVKGFLLAVLTLATAPAMAGKKVLVEWAHNFEVSRPKTFTWAPGTPAQSVTIETRNRSTIEQQLEADGLTFVEPGVRRT